MSSKISTSSITSIVISFILIAVLLPIGLTQLLSAVWPVGMDTTIETLITIVLPIMAVIGIVLKFIPHGNES